MCVCVGVERIRFVIDYLFSDCYTIHMLNKKRCPPVFDLPGGRGLAGFNPPLDEDDLPSPQWWPKILVWG